MLNPIAKNNLKVLFMLVTINTLAIVIAILKGIEQSIIPLLAFLGGQLVSLLLFNNIEDKK